MPSKLAELRKAAGLTQEAAAEALGLSLGGYRKKETGERGQNAEFIQKAAAVFRVDPNTLLALERPEVPLVGRVMAGDDGDYVFGLADDPNEFVEAPDSANDNTVAVEIKGNSLGRAFDGWLLFYDDIRSPVSPNMHGQLCVVQLIDDRTLVKIVQPSRNPGYYHLYSNTSEDPILDAEVVWAALVKDMRRR